MKWQRKLLATSDKLTSIDHTVKTFGVLMSVKDEFEIIKTVLVFMADIFVEGAMWEMGSR